LWFHSRDYARLGNQIKCNPAIKSRAHRDALFPALLDDRLDVLCANVENAIGADPTLAGMVKDCALTDTVVSHSFDGDAPIGSARMQFRIMYRTSELDAGSIIN